MRKGLVIGNTGLLELRGRPDEEMLLQMFVGLTLEADGVRDAAAQPT
jgi:hypothetical protein